MTRQIEHDVPGGTVIGKATCPLYNQPAPLIVGPSRKLYLRCYQFDPARHASCQFQGQIGPASSLALIADYRAAAAARPPKETPKNDHVHADTDPAAVDPGPGPADPGADGGGTGDDGGGKPHRGRRVAYGTHFD